VVNRLRQAGVETSAKQLLQLRTVARVVESLREGQPDTARLAVDLAVPQDPAARKIFLVHAGGGSVHWYLRLARELREQFHVVGIQAAGLDGQEAPLGDMEAIARRYWAEIRAVQPDGPCLLLGWSYGALVAHEMARLSPDDVESVFLLEPPMAEREGRVGERLRAYADGYRTADELWRQGQQQTGADRQRTEERLRAAVQGLEVAQDKVSLDDWLPYQALGLLYVAAMHHQVRPATAGAVLFVSADVRDAVDGSNYWKRACSGDMRVVDLPGTHMGMVAPGPSLELVVREITASLRR
jgi:thioesterase domain-containing protein